MKMRRGEKEKKKVTQDVCAGDLITASDRESLPVGEIGKPGGRPRLLPPLFDT